MECPFCSSNEIRVLESRSTDDNRTIRRRRECESCNKRFTTYERFEFARIVVSKRSGSREVYSRDKLIESIIRSCSKSQLSVMAVDAIVDKVEAEMYRHYNREISSQILGEMVMDQLRVADPLAYIRYASIFKQFSSATEFIDEVRSLEDELLGIKYELAAKN